MQLFLCVGMQQSTVERTFHLLFLTDTPQLLLWVPGKKKAKTPYIATEQFKSVSYPGIWERTYINTDVHT